jgi:hypothetical protein
MFLLNGIVSWFTPSVSHVVAVENGKEEPVKQGGCSKVAEFVKSKFQLLKEPGNFLYKMSLKKGGCCSKKCLGIAGFVLFGGAFLATGVAYLGLRVLSGHAANHTASPTRFPTKMPTRTPAPTRTNFPTPTPTISPQDESWRCGSNLGYDTFRQDLRDREHERRERWYQLCPACRKCDNKFSNNNQSYKRH